MGGRGASSGIGKFAYGTEYETVLQEGNIKFVKYKNANNAKAPLETKTKGRIYVTVNAEGNPAYVSYYDDQGKRTRTIDLLRPHNGLSPHAHDGYIHSGKYDNLTDEEKKLVENIRRLWYNNK